MDMILLTTKDRTELAELYVRHLGETSYTLDDIEFSPTRAYLAYVQEPFRPGRQVLSDEEILCPLQVTLQGGTEDGNAMRDLVSAARELLRTSLLVAGVSDAGGHWNGFWHARDQTHTALAKADEPEAPQGTPYYTADPTFLAWLEDDKRGWPVLCEFLDYFNPPWFREYVQTLAEAVQVAEDSDRQETHASMQGVAEACKERGT